jgi:hypothetical protein
LIKVSGPEKEMTPAESLAKASAIESALVANESWGLAALSVQNMR